MAAMTEIAASDVIPDASTEPQSTRSFHGPTPFSTHFTDVDSIYKIWTTYLSDGLPAALDLIPEGCDYLRCWLPQFKRHKGEKVVLVLGLCRLLEGVPCLEPATCYTEEVVASLERLPGVNVVLIDMRKECRRERGTESCASVGDVEAALLTVATAVEIAIAKHEFDIEFTKVISFSRQWGRNYQALQAYDEKIGAAIFQLQSRWIEQHLGHLGNASKIPDTAAKWQKTEAFEHEGLRKHDALFEPGKPRPPRHQISTAMTVASQACLKQLDRLQAGGLTTASALKVGRKGLARGSYRRAAPGEEPKCTVPNCNKKFSGLQSLRQHLRLYHDWKPVNTRDSKQCGYQGCSTAFETVVEADEHMAKVHSWTIDPVTGIFPIMAATGGGRKRKREATLEVDEDE